MSTFFQVGTLAGFLQGIYDGNYDYANLAKKGDFGLGTLNAVDGEMIAVDGQFYRVDANGVAGLIPPTAKTPFAVVTQFKAISTFSITNIPNIEQLNAMLDAHLQTPNIFYMIRIDCTLAWVKLRSEHCQIRNYLPLAEALPLKQTEFELKNSQGTLVITYAPQYSAGVTIAGYHHHYISHDKTTGGHVFDLSLQTGQVMISPQRQFEMALYDTKEFDNANLTADLASALNQVESPKDPSS